MGKRLKFLVYVFIICIIFEFIVIKAADEDATWAKIAKLVALGIIAIIILIYLSVFLFCAIENKKVGKFLDTNDYESLYAFASKKENSKHLFIPERVSYYSYLVLLSLLGSEKYENIDSYFRKVNKTKSFGISFYWNACYDFSIGKYDNLLDYKEAFLNSLDYFKNPNKYGNLAKVLDLIVLFANNKEKEASEKIDEIDMSNITMPSTLKSIEIIKNYKENNSL